jgi:hypothetical protein
LVNTLNLPAAEEFVSRAAHGATGQFSAADEEFPDTGGEQTVRAVLITHDIFGAGIGLAGKRQEPLC